MTSAALTTESPLLAGLRHTIELVETQIAQIQTTGAPTRGESGGDEAYHLDELEVFAQRLTQIIRWLEHDHDLLTVVDQHIGQQGKQLDQQRARRDSRLAVITTVGGAILGWLISAAATPLQVLQRFFH